MSNPSRLVQIGKNAAAITAIITALAVGSMATQKIATYIDLPTRLDRLESNVRDIREDVGKILKAVE